jgi:hypothetical protein
MIDHDRTSLAVRRHLGRHGIGVAFLLRELTPRGDANPALARDRDAGLVNYYTMKTGKQFLLPGHTSWAMLTKKGCESVGVPIERSIYPSHGALNQRLSIHAYCIATGAMKLESSEVQELTGHEPPDNVVYLLTQPPHIVYRVYVPTGDAKSTLEQIGRIAEEIVYNSNLAPWAKRGQLGILVLVESRQKRTAVQRDVRARRIGDPVRVDVAVSASLDTLEQYLNDRSKGHAHPDGDQSPDREAGFPFRR